MQVISRHIWPSIEVKTHMCVIYVTNSLISPVISRLTWQFILERNNVHVVSVRKFSRAVDLKRRMFVHTGNKLQYDICRKHFLQDNSLMTHMLIHTGEKPHTCVICKKQFSYASTLTTHMLKHTGEKPHTCVICKKQLSYANTLNTHMLIHTGDKPHTCVICKKQFSHASSLTTHMLIHTGEKP